ncbi:ferritin-like protein [Zobellella aerophila]|uniref:Ferritin-like protein n=1 Tax=Zobellella aerophila TaxID=870480 RepID=A0ABP6VH37_9GAMM
MQSLQEQKNALFPLLQTAMELELSTIPPYLTALLSIRPEANRVAANLIRTVMMEEMLHMTLVGNLTASLGGRVALGEGNLPAYPLSMEFEGQRFRDRQFEVDLAPFSEAGLDTFMQIEMPTDWMDREPSYKAFAEIEVPGITIGAFYQMIEQQLAQMCAQYPESEVFCGDPAHQIDENYYWAGGGKPVVITTLASAREALQLIIEQGEGAGGGLMDGDRHYFDQPLEVAHFFRFREIAFGRHYRPDDHPKEPPTGTQFEVDFAAVYPIIRNPKAADYGGDEQMARWNHQFNAAYSLMLDQIAQAFNGNPEVLYTAIVNGMHSLTPVARQMMTTPIAEDPEGRHGGPSFEWVPPPYASKGAG